MGVKEEFWNSIDADLPESIADLLDKVIDTTEVATPADVDAAIIEQGKLAAKLNKLLDDLQGLSLVELALRIGQKNVTSKLMLLSALEYVGGASGEGFQVVAPVEGKGYYGIFADFVVEILNPDIESVSVEIGEDTFDLEDQDGTFTATWAVAIGEWTATFTAGETEKAVTFEVKSYSEVPTIPAEGQSYTPEDLTEIQFLTGDSTESIEEGVSVAIDEDPAQSMTLVPLLGFTLGFTFTEEGLHSIEIYVGESLEKTVEFTITTS